VLGLKERLTKETSQTSALALNQRWHAKKPLLPVSSGGLHVGLLHQLLDMLGTDIAVQMGGGILGHPGGGRAGAKALRDALECYIEGGDLDDCARKSPGLRVALSKWGTLTYR
jgi:ribulose-bisphosphate carboxylase large chain